ncbi:hypothetical protein P3342_004870 [Pyrenophora teres f. teres]|nr:hypothetical protein P3342_004870 [Pyrenophora teres f. teres]
MDVNWTFLTPSVARLLTPTLVPSLKILAMGGEQVTSTDWDKWQSSVKLRGQRVELSEVEHYMQKCLPQAKYLAVEVVLPSGQKDHAMLAAFIQLDRATTAQRLAKCKAIENNSIAQIVLLAGVEEELAKRLPGYMVPTVFFSLLQFPMTTSGKID